MSKLQQYLEMANAIPSIHSASTFITVDTDFQFDNIKKWAEENNKKFGNIPRQFPIYINVSGPIVGWQDRSDRAVDYIKYRHFLNQIGE